MTLTFWGLGGGCKNVCWGRGGRESQRGREPLGATVRRQSGQKEKSLVFESGEQEKTGALIGGCQGDGPWGLLNFFSVLPPELSEAIECPPGLKAEGSGVDPELGGGSGLGRPRRCWACHPRPRAARSNKSLGTERLLNLARSRVYSLETQLVLGATRACRRQTLLKPLSSGQY